MPAVTGPGVRACMLSFYFHPSYSGSAVQAANLSRHLRDHGIESLVVSANLTASPRRELVNGLALYRLPVCSTPNLQIPSFWLSLAWFLIRHRKRYDIIHAHGTYQHAIASLVGRWLRKPTVLKIAMGRSDIAFHGQGRIWGRINRFLVSRFDRYIATSTEVYQECLEQELDPARVRQIPNGVDTDVFYPPQSPSEKSRIRGQLDMPDVPTVCYVGVIDARKNLDGILRVWKRVRDGTDTGHLLLIGPRPRGDEFARSGHFQELLRYIEENDLSGSVTFTGQQQDIPAYLRSADIFLFPSKREGMPNAVLEAMASGLACIASRIGGTTDIIQHGVNGFLFDVDDEQGMASIVRQLLRDTDQAGAIGAAGRRTVQESFSLTVTARRYAELYENLKNRGLARHRHNSRP